MLNCCIKLLNILRLCQPISLHTPRLVVASQNIAQPRCFSPLSIRNSGKQSNTN